MGASSSLLHKFIVLINEFSGGENEFGSGGSEARKAQFESASGDQVGQ